MLLEAEFPQYVTFFAVLLFAFLRPSEAEALKESDFQRGRVRVVGGKMKGRKRRFVPIRKGLKSYLDKYGWEVLTAFWQRECRKLSPVPWANDICRHTGISFRLAESGDERKTATEAGNSVETMFTYYHEPKSQAEAKVFWGIGATG
jgi:integrase